MAYEYFPTANEILEKIQEAHAEASDSSFFTLVMRAADLIQKERGILFSHGRLIDILAEELFMRHRDEQEEQAS